MEKKNILLIGVLVFVLSLVGVYVFAQGTVFHPASDIRPGTFGGTSNQSYSFPGRVGIGTTSPAEKLYVNEGNLYVDNASGGIGTNGGVTAKIFYDVDNTGYYVDPANAGDSLIVKGRIKLYDKDGNLGGQIWAAGDKDTLSINDSGGVGVIHIKGRDVGIDHSTPSAKLHVAGTVLARTFRTHSTFQMSSGEAHFIKQDKKGNWTEWATIKAGAMDLNNGNIEGVNTINVQKICLKGVCKTSW